MAGGRVGGDVRHLSDLAAPPPATGSQLAEREIDVGQLAARWQGWLEHEAELSRRGGFEPMVHG